MANSSEAASTAQTSRHIGWRLLPEPRLSAWLEQLKEKTGKLPDGILEPYAGHPMELPETPPQS